jgi:hypothetical protein
MKPRKPVVWALLVFPIVGAVGGVLIGAAVGEAGLYLGTLALSGGLTGLVCTNRGVGAGWTILLSAVSTVLSLVVFLLIGLSAIAGVCTANETGC